MRSGTADDLITQQCGFTEVPVKAERFAIVELNLSKLSLDIELFGRSVQNFNRLLDKIQIRQRRAHQQLPITGIEKNLRGVDALALQVGQNLLGRLCVVDHATAAGKATTARTGSTATTAAAD